MQLAHVIVQQLPPSPSVNRYQIPHHACAEFLHKTAHPPVFQPASSPQDILPGHKAAPCRKCPTWVCPVCIRLEKESRYPPVYETPQHQPCLLIRAVETAWAHHTQCGYSLLIPDLPYQLCHA